MSCILVILLHVSWKHIFGSSRCGALKYSCIFGLSIWSIHLAGFVNAFGNNGKRSDVFFYIFWASFRSKELWGLAGTGQNDCAVTPPSEASSEVQKLSICVVYRCSCSYKNLTIIQLGNYSAEGIVSEYYHIFLSDMVWGLQLNQKQKIMLSVFLEQYI